MTIYSDGCSMSAINTPIGAKIIGCYARENGIYQTNWSDASRFMNYVCPANILQFAVKGKSDASSEVCSFSDGSFEQIQKSV